MARSPDCGKTYMPRLETIYTDPFTSTFSLSLYSAMISSEMSLIWMRTYSGRLRGVMRQKFDMSIVIILAPFVNTTLLKRILTTSILAEGVATSPG